MMLSLKFKSLCPLTGASWGKEKWLLLYTEGTVVLPEIIFAWNHCVYVQF